MYKSVQFLTGRCTTKELYQLHNSCDCFVMPSSGEACCIPALEAMGFSNPVITNRNTGTTQYVNNKNGWLVDSHEVPLVISDTPIPGAVLIRDEKLLGELQGSNKLWRGTAEIEHTLPPGTVLPAPSQFLRFRNAFGEINTIAVVGKPFTKAELARLKLVGIGQSFTSMFEKVCTFTNT